MTEVPDEVARLGREREEKRKARDFAAADALRERILELGFELADSPGGTEFRPVSAAAAPLHSPGDVESVLGDPATVDFSVQFVVQGWPEDAVRGIESFGRNAGGRSVQFVVVDATGADAGGWPEGTEVVSLERDFGWAAMRNAGLRRATGRIVIAVDGSIEARGEVLAPIEAALSDSGVGVCGPFGIVTDDLREFRESEGPEVDAVEGYLMGFRREVLSSAGFFDERFKFYRAADIEFSFRVKNEGLRATVVQLPLERHEHRIWANTSPEERERLSKKNFYRFLDRWRGREDLTVSGEA